MDAAPTDTLNARPGPITDGQLAELERLARELEGNRITEEGATLLMMCLAPALGELRQRRAAMARIAATTATATADNVVALPDRDRGA
jgi:hypothetical protein